MKKVPKKLCVKCQERKPIFSFPRDPHNRKRFSQICFSCHIACSNLDLKQMEKTVKKKERGLWFKIEQQYYQSRKRADEYGVANTLTKKEWETVLTNAEGCCAYCGKDVGIWELTIEHIVPLSRGGPNSVDNVVAACKLCNLRKGTKIKAPKKLKTKIGAFRPTSS